MGLEDPAQGESGVPLLTTPNSKIRHYSYVKGKSAICLALARPEAFPGPGRGAPWAPLQLDVIPERELDGVGLEIVLV